MNARLSFLLPLLATALLGGCQWHMVDDKRSDAPTRGASGAPAGTHGSASTPSGAIAPTCTTKVDRWKELLVINRSILSDRRAKNDVAGAPWSLRTRLEELAGGAADAPALARAWFSEWSTRTSVGDNAAPVKPRPAIEELILEPWRQGLEGASAYAPLAALPLDSAPFRLVAIVNRIDLKEQELGCGGSAGELRFVYSAVDPKTRLAIPFSVIVEVPYPASRTPREWALRWHDIARLPFGAEYNDALAELTTEIVSKASRTSTRVRTNEIALGAKSRLPWELREFALSTTDDVARLVQIPLVTTPRIELARSPSLDAWALDNAAQVLLGTHVLPGGLQAGAAEMATPFFRWESASMSEELRHAFSNATCNGCHAGERPSERLQFQHLAPGDLSAGYYATTNGETQVSSYLHDPSGGSDELGRREEAVARMLCNECPATGSTSYEP